MGDFLSWIEVEYPDFKKEIKWNQPMYTYKGTFIISAVPYKKHIALAVEVAPLEMYREELTNAGYKVGKATISIPWGSVIDHDLMKKLIDKQLEDKKDFTKFWR